MSGRGGQTDGRQRLDRWLFFSRAVKSRSLAQKLIEAGGVRVNAERTVASDRRVGAGDVLTMTLHRQVKVWRILDPGTRRGPASEAARLYEDLSPPVPPATAAEFQQSPPAAGRPRTKEQWDALQALRRDAP